MPRVLSLRRDLEPRIDGLRIEQFLKQARHYQRSWARRSELLQDVAKHDHPCHQGIA